MRTEFHPIQDRYRYWIDEVSPDESAGMWDWRVTVVRRIPGRDDTMVSNLVSGGIAVAHWSARDMVAELEANPEGLPRDDTCYACEANDPPGTTHWSFCAKYRQ